MVVPGNHDRVQRLSEAGFVVLPPIHEIKLVDGDAKRRVVLCHYPIEEWNGLFQGSIHLHGHTHGTVPTPVGVRRMDVGVDAQGYMPVSAAEVLARLDTVRGLP